MLLLLVFFVFRDTTNPLPHQLGYGSEVTIIILRSVYIAFKVNPETKGMLLKSLFLYFSGFSCWLIERNFCDSVKFLQLHAFWHILTGTATFIYINFAIYHQLKLYNQKPIIWHDFLSYPSKNHLI